MTDDYVCRETKLALEHLSSLVQDGDLIGIAFMCVLRGKEFTAGWAGEAGQDSIFTPGALQHLNHKLIKRTEDRISLN